MCYILWFIHITYYLINNNAFKSTHVSSNVTHDSKLSLLNYKQNQLNETRHVIFNALIEINDKINPSNPIDRNRLKEINENYQDIGVSSKDLTLYLSNKHQPLIRKKLKKIKEDYKKKKIDQDAGNFLINNLNSKYHIYSERTYKEL